MHNSRSSLQVAVLVFIGAAFVSGCTIHASTRSSDEPSDDDSAAVTNHSTTTKPSSPSSTTGSLPAPSSSGPKAAEASPYDVLYASDKTGGDATKLEGLWKSTQLADGGFIADVRLDVHEGKARWANRCSGIGYQTVTVGVDAPITVSDTDIELVDQGGSFTRTGEGPSDKPPMRCTAKLTGPGKAEYTLTDGKLSLFEMEFAKVSD